MSARVWQARAAPPPDSRTRIGPTGVGLASTPVDTTGHFGIANQALLVRPR